MVEHKRRGWDEAEFIEGLKETFAPLEHLLEEGDKFDYERYRFFAAPNLNGGNEYVVFVQLTEDSPSVLVCPEIGETKMWPEIRPLPHVGILALQGTECFADMENGKAYLYRWLDWGECEMVDEHGVRARMATEAYWKRGGNDPEWLLFTGMGRTDKEPHGASMHMFSCSVVTTNQTGGS